MQGEAKAGGSLRGHLQCPDFKFEGRCDRCLFPGVGEHAGSDRLNNVHVLRADDWWTLSKNSVGDEGVRRCFEDGEVLEGV